ncbi:MAG: hypothetical protein C0446_08410 [Chitinophaga sp.]|nr:hypothetical protein [Chitinophaga sp.]
MSILYKILKSPNPILNKKTNLQYVPVKLDYYRKIGKELEYLCEAHGGLSLSAPQISILEPVIYVKDLGIMISPKIIKTLGSKIKIEEGSLSLGELEYYIVKRFTTIKLEWRSPLDGDKCVGWFAPSAFNINSAVVLQQAIDHLHGVTIDQIAEEKALQTSPFIPTVTMSGLGLAEYNKLKDGWR